MKHFIILSSTIRNMGGAQMYAANKMKYYESLGWKPDMYFYNQGPIRIKYLKQFEENLIPELSILFKDSNKTIREIVIRKVLGRYNEDDEILFECHMPHLAYWGEFLAQKVNGKNTVFLLEEDLPKFTAGETDFFEFKLKRKELLNGVDSFKWIFKRKVNLHDYENYGDGIKPYCSNVVDYTPIQLPKDIGEGDYNIISIGRLDKPYIKGMLDEIYIFTQRYNDKVYNLIIAGGDWEGKMNDYIRGVFKKARNVRLFLLGYVFPIPYDWIRIADVSIASSNSILVSSDEGIPTIGIDIHDHLPIGIYRHTTNNLWERIDEPQTPISMLLEEVLIKKKYSKVLVNHSGENNLAFHLKPHLDLLNASDPIKVYYDVVNMYSLKDKLFNTTKKVLRTIYLRIIGRRIQMR